VPALGARAGLDLASVDRDSLAHADEAVAAASPISAAVAVVDDRYLDRAVLVAREHLRARGARVLDGVRQALLDEAVRGQVDPRRKLRGVSFDGELDRKARLARLRDEAVQVLEAGLGS